MVDFKDLKNEFTIRNSNQDNHPFYIASQDNNNIEINFKAPFLKTGDKVKVDVSSKEELAKAKEDYKSLELENAVKAALPNASAKFINQIKEMAQKLQCDELDVAALLFKESQFKPNAGQGSYRGLGQMSKRSLALSIKYGLEHQEDLQGINPRMTMERFVKLSREEQMPYVKNYALAMKEEYFKGNKKMTGADLYALFLTPRYATKHTLMSAQSKNPSIQRMYKNNKELDKVNEKLKKIKDGKITKNDLQFVLDSIKTDVFKLELSEKVRSGHFNTKS